MNLVIRFLIVCLFFQVTFTGQAQRRKPKDTSAFIRQTNRIEFEIDSKETNYYTVAGGESGLLVVVETEEYLDEEQKTVFHFLDTLLNNQFTRIYPVPIDMKFVGHDYYSGSFYLLFFNPLAKKEKLMLLVIDPISVKFTHYKISTAFPMSLRFFEVLGSNVLISGYTNYRPVLVRYNLDEERLQVVPGFYENDSDILDLITDDERQLFTIVQLQKRRDRRFTIRTKTFTANADLIQDNTAVPGERKNLVDGASTIFSGGNTYVAGTYSKKASHFSKGIYLAKFVNGRQQFIEYIDYSALNNFFGYLKERRESKIKRRIARKKEKGRSPNFNYRLMVHDLVKMNDQYVLIAEAYYPSYSSYSTNAYTISAPLRTSQVTYKYTHVIVVAFDKNGKLVWDNSFGIDDTESLYLDEIVNVQVLQDKIYLTYLQENTIRCKIVSGNEIIEGETYNPVKLAFARDEIRSKDPDIEELHTWYGHNSFASGIQYIRNDEAVTGKIYRRVFYINKIEYY